MKICHKICEGSVDNAAQMCKTRRRGNSALLWLFLSLDQLHSEPLSISFPQHHDLHCRFIPSVQSFCRVEVCRRNVNSNLVNLRLRGGSSPLNGTLTVAGSGPNLLLSLNRELSLKSDPFWETRGLSEVVPYFIADLDSKRKNKTLSPFETELYNLLVLERKLHRNRQLRHQYNGSVIASELHTTEGSLTEVLSKFQSLEKEGGDAALGAQLRERALQLVQKRDALERMAAEVRMERRYKKVKSVVRDEDGDVTAVVQAHSPWLDLVDNAAVDDVAEWELGLRRADPATLSRYATVWSKRHIARNMFLEGGRRVTRDMSPEEDRYMATARAEHPLPRTGIHYFEVVVSKPPYGPVSAPTSLGGGTYIGLMDGNVTDFGGCWEMESHRPATARLIAGRRRIDRRQHIMALHDACLAPRGEVTWAGGLRRPWVKGGSYGHGDRVGVLVNMDTRTANVYKNGRRLGKAWGQLPDELYPTVCLFARGATAELTFPPPPAGEVDLERRQSDMHVQQLAVRPPPAPPPLPLEDMLEDPFAHKEALGKELRTRIRRLRRKLEGKRWDILTIADWVHLHKCRWGLWFLGLRPRPPATRFVNHDDLHLVLRGDGDGPPLPADKDIEEQARLKAAAAAAAAAGRTVPDPGLGGAAAAAAAAGEEEGGEGGDKKAKGKKEKKGLSWKMYRRAQKEERRAARRKVNAGRRAEAQAARAAERLELPDSPLIAPQWRRGLRPSRKEMGLPTLPAENNPRRAVKALKAALTPPRKRRRRDAGPA